MAKEQLLKSFGTASTGISLAVSLSPALASSAALAATATAIPVVGGIAAGVMAAIGVFTKRGKQKRAAADLEQKFQFATNDILREVQADRLSPEEGVRAMQAILNEGVQTFSSKGARRKLGVASDRAIRNMTEVINANIAAAKAHQPPVLSKLRSLNPAVLAVAGSAGLLVLGRLFR